MCDPLGLQLMIENLLRGKQSERGELGRTWYRSDFSNNEYVQTKTYHISNMARVFNLGLPEVHLIFDFWSLRFEESIFRL